MHKSILISILVFLLIASFASADTSSKEPLSFKFGEIPFSKTVDEVMEMIGDAKAKLEDYTSISIGSYKRLINYFDGPLYSWFGIATSLNSNVVQKYTITYDKWDNIKEINLYFVKNINSKEYRLFLVRKLLKEQEGNYKNAFNGISKAIISKVGKPYKVFETEYYELFTQSNSPSVVGIWKTRDQQIFLLIASWWGTEIENIEILYLSTKGLHEYVKACNWLEKEKKKKQQEKIQKVGNSSF